MIRFILLLSLLALPLSVVAQPPQSVAWNIVEGLTTEVGPRLAGTEAESMARIWAVGKLKALGFSNVRSEAFVMPVWVRGDERASLTYDHGPQNLIITALGNSGATPTNGLNGEVIGFSSLEEMIAAPNDEIRGKIVYIGNAMHATQDGSSYGYFGNARRKGPNIAAKKGAVAVVIRSIGTDHHRMPHTGVTNWDADVKPIPSAALSSPDADQIERNLARQHKCFEEFQQKAACSLVSLKLLLTPKFIGERQSGNVIAEVPGTDPAAGVVVIGGHLDSWDLGTGAIDDGAGVAITTAAAKAILDSGKKPRRTVRVIWWGAEEVGGFGGAAYFKAHGTEAHAFASESDFGADRIWRVDFGLPDSAKALVARLTSALAALGIGPGSDPASGGTDVGELVKSGVPVIDLQQDGTRYFDLHHTADDTLDKIDRVQLEQNVAAWAIVLDAVANAPENLLFRVK
jgi:carboxypeptidase Q